MTTVKSSANVMESRKQPLHIKSEVIALAVAKRNVNKPN